MEISVVVVNYNGADFLEKCLLSLIDLGYEIVVVDDGSSDESVEMVKKEFPSVILIEREKNEGPTVARNIGARAVKGDVIVFSDCDVVYQKETIVELVSPLKKNTQIGIVGAQLKERGKEEIMKWSFGYHPGFIGEFPGYVFGFFSKIGIFPLLTKKIASNYIAHYGDSESPQKIDWVIESCFAVKREVFDRLGGFDEEFFMFFEGPDLSRRAEKIGYETWYNPKAKAIALPHHTHKKNRKRDFIRLGSESYYHYKHGQSRLLAGFRISFRNWLYRVAGIDLND